MRYYLLALGGFSFLANAQDTVRIRLKEAIETGIRRSVDADIARNEYISAYWEYKTYRTEWLPEATLEGEGSLYGQTKATLSIRQQIPLTGATVTLESGLNTLPARLSLEQPLFGFNRIRWLQRIEPVRYLEAQRKLVGDQEAIALTAIEHYFNLLLGRILLDMAEQNRSNAARLYLISEARQRKGQLSTVDLLQMQASLLRAEASLTDARASFEDRMFRLRSFLGMDQDVALEPVEPEFITEDIPRLSYPAVLALALERNVFTQNIRKRILEASRDVSQARADRWNLQLFASLGPSPTDNRLLTVGVRLPVLDWGKGKGKVKVAESNRRIVQSKIEKEQMDFKQDIFLRVQYFNNQPEQLRLARLTDEIAQQRYKASVEAFILGKIDILNLNDAQTAKDAARRDYINQMFLLWSYYYQIRSLTLYDFLQNKEISVDYDES
ncbi:MAG: TolC family protein [Tannerellaceae bacterium]|jgi:outer membrane protein TolC|nr:TolC family protein [Tannerellaceae bacterium]